MHSVDEIKVHVAALKKLHPKAIHFCLAWKLGTEGNLFRANDDGEPSGSAGKPILGQIESLGLTNTLVVVVRYWGGTLLGVPGLINAYKTAAADALKQADIVVKNIEKTYTLSFDYTLQNEVMRILKQDHCTVQHTEQMLFIEMKVGIPVAVEAGVVEKLKGLHQVKVSEGESMGK